MMRLRRDHQFALACSLVMLIAWIVLWPDRADHGACRTIRVTMVAP